MDLIEGSELPQVCQECLGSIKKIRMIQDSAGSECRLCSRGFVTFRWKPPRSAAMKQTIICTKCATKRNACQSCLFDIEYNISLSLRDAALRIMAEEGGTEKDAPAVLAAIKSMISQNSARINLDIARRSSDIDEIIRRFPLPGLSRPAGCQTLCVYGIEQDFDINSLRSYFGASIIRTDYVPAGRYAFFEFEKDSVPELQSESVILDGRKLLFAWSDHVAVKTRFQSEVGAVVRAFLRWKAQEYISS